MGVDSGGLPGKRKSRRAGTSESGARRIRTADLLGAIQRGRKSRHGVKNPRFAGNSYILWSPRVVVFLRGYAGICGDTQGVGHSWREVPEIGAGRLERTMPSFPQTRDALAKAPVPGQRRSAPSRRGTAGRSAPAESANSAGADPKGGRHRRPWTVFAPGFRESAAPVLRGLEASPVSPPRRGSRRSSARRPAARGPPADRRSRARCRPSSPSRWLSRSWLGGTGSSRPVRPA
jgi:hypothetical protein